MRRILSLVLAMAITLSIALLGGVSVSAESNLAASDECINILKKYEGFSKYPYWDYGQWTVGYGTRCPSDMVDHYKANGISEADAENLLKEFLENYNEDVNEFADKYNLTMTQNQFDALVLFSFNCGSGWVYSPNQNFHKTMAMGASADPVNVLYWFGTWSNAGGSPNRALIRRRMCEAEMYLNGNYSVTPPEHYGYVIYNANGGSVTSRIHAYNTSATPITPTYDGHTFMGWYTAITGGYQVTTLDESTDELTLYARWDDAGTTDGSINGGVQDIDPLKITVTSNYVNLRKGPGTNYATVGQANKGDQYEITQIAVGSGHTWGNFSTGWISLTYTNYEEVKDLPGQTAPVDPAEPTEPKPTEPEETEPEETEPEATEPEVTEPQPTEPEPTEPEDTKPESTAVTGKVKANGGLNIRSGPGTGYSTVGHLSNGAAVTVLEQKNVGSMTWGRTDKGWISMQYVVLDSNDQDQTEPEKPSDPEDSGDQSGSVTGYIKANGGLNIRSGAGTTYGIVGAYSNGDKVTVTQQQTVGSVTWGKTDRGWISMNYFTTQAPGNSGGSNNDSTQPQGSAGTIKVDGMLCIRSGPGTSYAVQGYYRNGDKVTITQRQTVGSMTWGKTDKGWVSMDYVVLDGSADQDTDSTEPSAETRTVTANCLNVRSSAGTGSSVVGYLYAGTKVQILEKTTVNGVSWGKISTGWICLDYTK